MPHKSLTFTLLAVATTIGGVAAFAQATQESNSSEAISNGSTRGSVGNQQSPSEIPKADANQRADKTRLLMKAKLASSQKVMEGLVTENFELIKNGAKQMKEISEAAHWPTAVDEVYQHHSVEFRRQCDKLVEQATRRDLQAAHYTYLHLTTNCFDCHNYVRPRFKVKRTKPGAPVQLIPTYWDQKNRKDQRPQPDGEKNDKTG